MISHILYQDQLLDEEEESLAYLSGFICLPGRSSATVGECFRVRLRETEPTVTFVCFLIP